MGRKSAPRATAEAHDASTKVVSPIPGRASYATIIQQTNLVLQVAAHSFDIDASSSFSTHPPLVSVLGSISAQGISPARCTSLSRPSASPSQMKAKEVCENLRSALPSFDRVSSVFGENGSWWDSFRDKTRVISQAHFEDIDTFSAKAYTSMKPAEVGTLAVAYARSLNQGFHPLMETVENLVLSDISYAATTDGMMCLILLGKTYTDIGHPRRAWLVWRRGITVAQLMVCVPSITFGVWLANKLTKGYHREDCVDPGGKGAWCAVYHGDRFTSMLLGLPHGCSDSILEPQFKNVTNTMPLEHHFTHRCAVVAGRIIERNVASAKLAYSELMAIDEEMDAIADSTPQSWWAIPDNLLISYILNFEELRERLLLHFYFFHVRLHLHLPSMTTSKTVHATTHVSRLACIAAARQLIKRFNVLNMMTPKGKRLFECKTSIFVAFTGAVVLALGMCHLIDLRYSEVDSQEDERLLLTFYAALQDEERRNGCNISSQCRTALGALLTVTPHGHGRDGGSNLSADEMPCEMRIPYFGKISRLKAGGGSEHGEPQPVELGLPPMTNETLSAEVSALPSAATSTARDSWIYEYPETWMSVSLLAGSEADTGYDNLFSQLDMLEMDLDWDWASFSTNEMG
ncbi:hypothetical protein TSTA_015490 [Talaromyces stipitatus ATCC 10500]|uniref:Transcription factor domain-containing protein n=1 Tax=Talaromyces stipitatus (strain ATCC 10500 / CBS 375.48 / QM 6759 / NRRL 1006) TaxID=441959 RepID=B8MHY3_TALSN|nr:uncharacterized protein TSTA_015490 [Talaromyces stipitatus ATCC 10500]EED16463.1 hypothetical protein TSTA_015490 [Talaromyces stipitatus ATCC 10500]